MRFERFTDAMLDRQESGMTVAQAAADIIKEMRRGDGADYDTGGYLLTMTECDYDDKEHYLEWHPADVEPVCGPGHDKIRLAFCEIACAAVRLSTWDFINFLYFITGIDTKSALDVDARAVDPDWFEVDLKKKSIVAFETVVPGEGCAEYVSLTAQCAHGLWRAMNEQDWSLEIVMLSEEDTELTRITDANFEQNANAAFQSAMEKRLKEKKLADALDAGATITVTRRMPPTGEMS